MAISIAYGIGFATVLTLLMLPLFLSFSNKVKVFSKWLKTGDDTTKEEVERAIKEMHEEELMSGGSLNGLNGQHSNGHDVQIESENLEDNLA